jgi:Protein of unknown function (DUF4038)/Putative collagen-binding domain of a collagenase
MNIKSNKKSPFLPCRDEGVKSGLCLALVVVATAVKAWGEPAYPLQTAANRHYLVDHAGAPFLMIGDAPHSLIVNLDTADETAYVMDRRRNGFNSLWIELLCNTYTGGPGTETPPTLRDSLQARLKHRFAGQANYGHDINNNNPFTKTLAGGYYDLTTPNPAYWSHVDWLVRTAATNGLQCFFTPLDQGGWMKTALANGTNGGCQYGRFLGGRYKDYPNIFWCMGNDFQDWSTTTNDAVILAIANGIQSLDTHHPMTIELNYWMSDSLTDPKWAPELSVDGIYAYDLPYVESLAAYHRTNYLPCLFLEGNYEFENNSGRQPPAPLVLRLQEYESLLSGCLAGHMYGNHYTWTFTSGWRSHLDTMGILQLRYFKNFFTKVNWFKLAPDQSHKLVTSGYGTFDTNHDFLLTANNYVTGAQTPDGTLGVVYCPKSTVLTLCLTNFAGPVTAKWYDPTTGTYTAVAGSPFANTLAATNLTTPGNNAARDPDWVLLLEARSSKTNFP